MHWLARGRRQEGPGGPPDADIDDNSINLKPNRPNVHDDYISKDYLDYFVLYYQKCLINILQNDVGAYLIKED